MNEADVLEFFSVNDLPPLSQPSAAASYQVHEASFTHTGFCFLPSATQNEVTHLTKFLFLFIKS